MKQSEVKDLERQLEITRHERDALFDSYVGAQKDTAQRIYCALVSEFHENGGEISLQSVSAICKAYGAEVDE